MLRVILIYSSDFNSSPCVFRVSFVCCLRVLIELFLASQSKIFTLLLFSARQNKILMYEKNMKRTKKKKIKKFTYDSNAYTKLRNVCFAAFGAECMSCGSTKQLQIDHILPVSVFYKYRLNLANLQILCASCNTHKSNKYVCDYRTSDHHNSLSDFISSWSDANKHKKRLLNGISILNKMKPMEIYQIDHENKKVILNKA